MSSKNNIYSCNVSNTILSFLENNKNVCGIICQSDEYFDFSVPYFSVLFVSGHQDYHLTLLLVFLKPYTPPE